MRKLLYQSLAFAVAIALASCEDGPPVGPVKIRPVPEYLGSGNYKAVMLQCCGLGDTLMIDSAFELWFGETTFDSTIAAHKQFIALRTVQFYGSYLQYLITHVETRGGRILIEIEGVQFPRSNADNYLSRSYVHEFFKIPTGTYDIEIGYRSKRSTFALSVTDSTMAISKKSGDLITALYNLYWRFKKNQCALFCNNELADTSHCGGYVDSILANVSLTPIVYPDSGVRPFEIVPLPGNVSPWSVQNFQYTDTSDFTYAGEILLAYSESLKHAGIASDVFLIDYRGKRIASLYR